MLSMFIFLIVFLIIILYNAYSRELFLLGHKAALGNNHGPALGCLHTEELLQLLETGRWRAIVQQLGDSGGGFGLHMLLQVLLADILASFHFIVLLNRICKQGLDLLAIRL
jgi:hypothetical protein